MNIIEAMHDQRFFLPVFKDVRTWRSWETYLRALFGLGIDNPEDLKLFRECTGLIEQPRERARESVVVCGRRGGKSFISSIIAVYLATFKDWSKVLSPGEVGWIFILSVDKRQSGIIKNYIKALLDGSPSFRRLVKNETQETIELKNGVNIGIKTSSFRSVRGYTILCAILEELAFWRSEDSANPDREIVAALKPSLLNVPDSMLLSVSTPYGKSGVLYEQWKTNYGQPGGPLIWKAESTKMNPTLDPAMIQRELEADPEAARAEWLAEFRSDVTAFLPSELVESAVIPGRVSLPKIEGVQYFGFTDPSGGRQDSFCLGISHRESNGKIVLDVLEERKPPFNPESVTEEFCGILKAYGISRIEGDRYAGAWVSDTFRKYGIHYCPAEKTASELYQELLPRLTSGGLELLDLRRLKGQLAGLERRTRSGGKDLITHSPGGHDDLANAAAGAVVRASRHVEIFSPEALTRMMFPEPKLSWKARFDEYVENWLLDIPQKPWTPEDDMED